MPAYAIFSLRQLHNAEAMQQYRIAARPSILQHGGRVIVARGVQLALEGAVPLATVVIEFDSLSAAQAWYYSPEYQEAAKLRQGAADIDVYITEGFTPPAI